MKGRRLKEGVYSVGAVDWDRRLFDALIPLPDGTSYNAYLIQGSEKTALLDTVDPSKTDVLLANLAGPAHGSTTSSPTTPSRTTPARSPLSWRATRTRRCSRRPRARACSSTSCTSPRRGSPPSTTARPSPWATRRWSSSTPPGSTGRRRWCTYLREDRILFTCDLFGSHLATSDLYADEARVLRAGQALLRRDHDALPQGDREEPGEGEGHRPSA